MYITVITKKNQLPRLVNNMVKTTGGNEISKSFRVEKQGLIKYKAREIKKITGTTFSITPK